MGGQGNVILLRYKSGSESTHQREEGFLEALAKDFPEIKVISENQYTDTTAEGSLAKAQELLLKYRDQVNGIFAVCEPNSVGVLGALEESELAGKVKFIAFDSSPRLIAAMNEDKVHGIVLQDPETMGYEAIKMLVTHLRGETISQRHVATGQYVATAKNQSEPKIKALLHPAQVDN
jgi:ribose transport system substrate-binding protein